MYKIARWKSMRLRTPTITIAAIAFIGMYWKTGVRNKSVPPTAPATIKLFSPASDVALSNMSISIYDFITSQSCNPPSVHNATDQFEISFDLIQIEMVKLGSSAIE